MINRRSVGPGPQTGPSPGTTAVPEEQAAEGAKGGGPYLTNGPPEVILSIEKPPEGWDPPGGGALPGDGCPLDCKK